MDSNLRKDMDETIEQGKAETERMRAETKASAEEAKASLADQTDAAQAEVDAHLDDVRDTATGELNAAADQARQLGSAVEHEREDAEDRLVEMLDRARDRQASHEGAGERIAHETKGFFESIKNKITGKHD